MPQKKPDSKPSKNAKNPGKASVAKKPLTASSTPRQMAILEKNIIRRLASRIGSCQTEVRCKAGIVDILTPSEIIEVKRVRNWKSAIGQCQVYHLCFPDRSMRVHLFGKCPRTVRRAIADFAAQLHVKITFEK